MIRTKTTIVVGPGAGEEVLLPGKQDLLAQIISGLDFARIGSDLQSDDNAQLAELFKELAARLKANPDDLLAAAARVRTSARIAYSIDCVLEQHIHDPLATAAAKLAIARLTLQAEVQGPLHDEPVHSGDLPLKGAENWLFQLGRLITSGVPRAKAEHCFDNLAIVTFGRDRSIEHFLPFVVQMAFGMDLDEARALVGEKLNIAHPLGSAGRLPWEPGKTPDVDWGDFGSDKIHALITTIDAPSESMKRKSYVAGLHKAIGGSKRIVFLGFDFHPLEMDFLFGGKLEQQPDVLATVHGMAEPAQLAATRMMQDRAGLQADRLGLLDMRPHQLLSEFGLFLES